MAVASEYVARIVADTGGFDEIRRKNAELRKELASSVPITSIEQFTSKASTNISGLGTTASNSFRSISSSISTVSESFPKLTNVTQGSFQSITSSAGSVPVSLNQIFASMTNVGNSVQAGMGQAVAGVDALKASAQNAGQTVANAGATGATGLAGIAPAATTAGQGLAGLGSSAGNAGQGLAGIGANAGNAATSLGNVSIAGLSTKDALSALETQFKSNESSIVNLGTQIADNRTKMAGLTSQLTDLTISGGKYRTEVDAQGKSTKVLSDEYVGLKHQLSQMRAAQGELTAQQGVYSAAQRNIIQTTGELTDKSSFLKKVFTEKTTAIMTSGTAFQGLDRIMQTAAMSMGGISIAASLGITVIGLLAKKIFDSNKETERSSQIVSNAAAAYIVLANAQSQVSQASANASISIAATGQAISGSALASANLIASFDSIATNQKKVDSMTRELSDSYNILVTTGQKVETTIDELKFTQQVVTKTTADLRSEISGYSTTINDSTKAMAPAIESVRLLQAVTGASTTDVLEAARAQRLLSDDSLPAVRRALEGNIASLQTFAGQLANSTNRTIDMTQAALRLSFALANIKVPTFDVSATEQGVRNLFKTAEAAYATAYKQFNNARDAAAAAKPDIDAANKAMQQYAATHAEGATQAQRNASAQSIYNSKQREFTQNGEAANAQAQRFNSFISEGQKPLREGSQLYQSFGLATNRAGQEQRNFSKDTVAAIKINEQANETMKVFTASAHKGAGGARAMRSGLDEMRAGAMGAYEALQLINTASLADLEKLFTPMKKIPDDVRELSRAFKDLTPVVNEFLSSQGIAAKVTDAELAKMAQSHVSLRQELLQSVGANQALTTAQKELALETGKGKSDLFDYTGAWVRQNEVWRQAGIEMAGALHAPLKEVNALLKEHGFEIELSARLWDILTPAQKRAAVTLSEYAKAAKLANIETDAQRDHFNRAVDAVTHFDERVHLAFDDLKNGRITASQFGAVVRGEVAPALQIAADKAKGLSTELTSLADRNAKAIAKFKEGTDNLISLQGLNFKIGVFDTIIAQVDHLAAVSGQDKDIVLANFRDMLAGSVATTEDGAAKIKEQIALIDQAILNSQLAKLEDAWGRPAGRAIQAILVHYDKLSTATGNLKTSMLAKVTAVGELFAVLPGKVGQSVSKVINTINTVIDIATKALNVLEAFGVKLPKPIQDWLDILNRGAGSTTAVMKQMGEDVKLILQDMSQQVIAIFKQMAAEAKR